MGETVKPILPCFAKRRYFDFLDQFRSVLAEGTVNTERRRKRRCDNGIRSIFRAHYLWKSVVSVPLIESSRYNPFLLDRHAVLPHRILKSPLSLAADLYFGRPANMRDSPAAVRDQCLRRLKSSSAVIHAHATEFAIGERPVAEDEWDSHLMHPLITRQVRLLFGHRHQQSVNTHRQQPLDVAALQLRRFVRHGEYDSVDGIRGLALNGVDHAGDKRVRNFRYNDAERQRLP